MAVGGVGGAVGVGVGAGASVGVGVPVGAGVGLAGVVVVGAGAGVVGAGWLRTDGGPPPATTPAPEPRAASRGCVDAGAAELVGAGTVVGVGSVRVGSRLSGTRG